MEIDSERSLETLSTEASTEWRRERWSNAEGEETELDRPYEVQFECHASLEISTKNAVVTFVASHRESHLQKGINADS